VWTLEATVERRAPGGLELGDRELFSHPASETTIEARDGEDVASSLVGNCLPHRSTAVPR
jgi:hypothetical protein